MTIFTHSLLPVTVWQAGELIQQELPAYRVQLKTWAILAVCGALPDILNPHLSVGDRYNSYSHMFPFTALAAGLGICMFIVFMCLHRRRQAVLALCCSAAYALHVAADIVSGGLDFFNTGGVIGDYWITPELWPVSDLLLIVIFMLLHRQIRIRHGLPGSILRAAVIKR